MTRRMSASPPIAHVVAGNVSVAEDWKRVYHLGGDHWQSFDGGPARSKAVYEALVALGPTPHPNETAKVIGNRTWAHLACTHCHERVLQAYRAEPEGYDKEDAPLICAPCVLAFAVQLGVTS